MSFVPDLAVGHAAEQTIIDELVYHGIHGTRPQGKSPYDFQLSDGRKCEAKLDLFSCRTGNGLIEFPSLQRDIDLYFHIMTYCKVFTHEQYQWLYMHGKASIVGDSGYDARRVPKVEMRANGIFLDQFIKQLKQ